MNPNENDKTYNPDDYLWQKAEYHEQVIPAYQDNPFIEALPDILSDSDAYRAMRYLPPFSEEDRNLPDELRYQAIFNINVFFKPLSVHLDLQRRIAALLRIGYRGRNPMNKHYYKNLTGALDDIKEIDKLGGKLRATSPSFYIVGISGVGKSTTVEVILSLYPQVIKHHEYKGKPFNFFQIVWLIINCPLDGSLTGLCISFFQAIDELLGTNYRDMYARKGSSTIDSMQEDIRRLVRLHGIGCLIIDEIQQLSIAKGQGTVMMLNFFVNLVNSAGLFVILIGTPKALPTLTQEFQQARRASGAGDMKWYPMNYLDGKTIDKEWDMFAKTLFQYQYVKKQVELTDALSKALHYASAGIVDFAIKAFILAQFRAIELAKETKIEIITPELITSVATDSFTFADHILEMIRNHKFDELENIPDLKLFDLETHYQQFLSGKNRNTDAEAIEEMEKQVNGNNLSKGALLQPSTTSKTIQQTKPKNKRTRDKILEEISTQPLSPDDLRTLLAISIRAKSSFPDLLKERGYVKEVSEFFG